MRSRSGASLPDTSLATPFLPSSRFYPIRKPSPPSLLPQVMVRTVAVLQVKRRGMYPSPLPRAFDGGEDFVGGFGPPEGFGIFVVPVDEGTDIGFERSGRGMNAAPQLLAGELREPALDLIDP